MNILNPFWVILGVNIADGLVHSEDVEVHSDSDSVADTDMLVQPECVPLGLSACRTLPQPGRSLGFQIFQDYIIILMRMIALIYVGIMIVQI